MGPPRVSPKIAYVRIDFHGCRKQPRIGTEPNVIFRLLIGLSIFAIGFYLGRELQRTAPIREELAAKKKSWDTPD